jgi:hypothetical protein
MLVVAVVMMVVWLREMLPLVVCYRGCEALLCATMALVCQRFVCFCLQTLLFCDLISVRALVDSFVDCVFATIIGARFNTENGSRHCCHGTKSFTEMVVIDSGFIIIVIV